MDPTRVTSGRARPVSSAAVRQTPAAQGKTWTGPPHNGPGSARCSNSGGSGTLCSVMGAAPNPLPTLHPGPSPNPDVPSRRARLPFRERQRTCGAPAAGA
eukprot:scaffold203_cov386-Prasinococcus_capsulatus_cf.AAC.6